MTKKIINKFLKAVDHRITMGHAVIDDGEDMYEYVAENKNGAAYICFYPNTLKVHSIGVEDYLKRKQFYIWYGDPDEPQKDESPYARTDELYDILDKIRGILNNQNFNPDVTMHIDFGSEKEKQDFIEYARNNNMTVDDLMIKIIRENIIENKDESGK